MKIRRGIYRVLIISTLLLPLAIIAIQSAVYNTLLSLVIANIIVGSTAFYLLFRIRADLSEVVGVCIISTAIGLLIYRLVYYIAIGMNLEKQGITTLLKFLETVMNTGIFITMYIIDLGISILSMVSTVVLLSIVFSEKL